MQPAELGSEALAVLIQGVHRAGLFAQLISGLLGSLLLLEEQGAEGNAACDNESCASGGIRTKDFTFVCEIRVGCFQLTHCILNVEPEPDPRDVELIAFIRIDAFVDTAENATSDNGHADGESHQTEDATEEEFLA